MVNSKSVRNFVRKFSTALNMATNFYLESRTDKKGFAPIRVSISIAGARLVTSSGAKINPADWNTEKNEPKKSAPAHVKMLLAQIKLHFSEYENQVAASRAPFSNTDLKAEWQREFGKAKRTQTLNEQQSEPQLSLFDVIDLFVKSASSENNWSPRTQLKFNPLKTHLSEFCPNVTFENLTEAKLNAFVGYLRDKKQFRNSTILKTIKSLKWFLRWATAKGYNQNTAFVNFAPKFKTAAKTVVFLDWSELMKVYNYEIPANGTELKLTDGNGKEYTKVVHDSAALKKTRDIFCFCAFTSLRYSDVAALRVSNINGALMTITTQKTADTITIDLNKYALAILEKYKTTSNGGFVFPSITNQRMNEYIKEVCELCEINNPITQTYYIGNTRYDETKPKFELIGTHAARRTFVCNALMLGIPSEIVMKWTGHCDYKTMKPYIDVTNKAKASAMALFDEL